MYWLMLVVNCVTPASSMENGCPQSFHAMSPAEGRRSRRLRAPGGALLEARREGKGTGGPCCLPEGSRASRAPPPGEHTFPLDGGKKRPWLDSSFSGTPLAPSFPFAHRIRAAGGRLEETMVPTRTNAVRGPWDTDFAFAVGGATATSSPARGRRGWSLLRRRSRNGTRRGSGVVRATVLGAYARRERYPASVMPMEPAATTMEIPSTARCTGFRHPLPEGRI